MLEFKTYSNNFVSRLEKLAETHGFGITVVETGKHFQQSSSLQVNDATQPIRDFMSGAIILDTFSLHSERRNFLASLEDIDPELHAIYEGNRMRYNNLLALASPTSKFTETIRKNTALDELWLSSLDIIPRSSIIYDDMNRDGKLRIVKALSASLSKIIKTL